MDGWSWFRWGKAVRVSVVFLNHARYCFPPISVSVRFFFVPVIPFDMPSVGSTRMRQYPLLSDPILSMRWNSVRKRFMYTRIVSRFLPHKEASSSYVSVGFGLCISVQLEDLQADFPHLQADLQADFPYLQADSLHLQADYHC